MANQVNISRAQTITVKINDYDNMPLSLTYQDNTNPSSPVAIDLTNYAFQFDLKYLDTTIKSYTLAAGVMSNSYLTKGGTGNSVLDMTGLWDDVRTEVNFTPGRRLIQFVTDSSGNAYVHLVYDIDVSKY